MLNLLFNRNLSLQTYAHTDTYLMYCTVAVGGTDDYTISSKKGRSLDVKKGRSEYKTHTSGKNIRGVYADHVKTTGATQDKEQQKQQ